MHILERQPRETARDYALRVISHNIITLALEPGSRVSENELAKELGLSRTPVREALMELATSDLVQVFPQQGSVVAKIDYHKVEEAFFLRQIMETAIIQEVCDKATPENIQALEHNLALQKLYLEQQDTEKLLETDNIFHYFLFEIATKLMCYKLMRSVSPHLDRVRHLSLSAFKNVDIVDDHHKIVEAIKNRDKDLARASIVLHLTRFRFHREAIQGKYAPYFLHE